MSICHPFTPMLHIFIYFNTGRTRRGFQFRQPAAFSCRFTERAVQLQVNYYNLVQQLTVLDSAEPRLSATFDTLYSFVCF